MGCYGRENAYFLSGDKRFFNCVWIELIGFDNTAEDYGVGRFLDAAGFVPHAVSFHLSSIDFVNTHPGMEQELPIPLYSCSYGAHTHNDERERQNWTNWQMKGLVDALHTRGVKVFSSFFDLEYIPSFCAWTATARRIRSCTCSSTLPTVRRIWTICCLAF
ncbi:MAG: hypothetical protein RR482_07765 [Clostridia bacterium]